MNSPQTALAARPKRIHRLSWQRVAVGQMRIFRPQREAALWIAYSTGYVFLAAITGLLIRRQHGIAGSQFSQDPWYFMVFKIGGLLIVPLLIYYRQGYGARDLLLDWRPNARQVLIGLGAFAAGFALNWWHLAKIVTAAPGFAPHQLAWRLAAGLFLPLLMAGLPEEIVYRGILQTRLEAILGRAAAVVLQSALFAAWHFPSRYLLANGVEGHAGNVWSVMTGTVFPAFIAGLIFGILWDRYRRLVPLITLHWGVDTLPMISTMLGIRF